MLAPSLADPFLSVRLLESVLVVAPLTPPLGLVALPSTVLLTASSLLLGSLGLFTELPSLVRLASLVGFASGARTVLEGRRRLCVGMESRRAGAVSSLRTL